jgi:hypothetical protein
MLMRTRDEKRAKMNDEEDIVLEGWGPLSDPPSEIHMEEVGPRVTYANLFETPLPDDEQ